MATVTRRTLLATLPAVGVAVAGCSGDEDGTGTDGGTGTNGGTDGDGGADGGAGPKLSTPAFDPGTRIPTGFTCDGEDRSPPLRIGGVPDRVESLALVVDDPDAGAEPFVHWLLWNVPPDATEIPEGIPREPTVADLDGAAQGTNDFDVVGYRGPCPPEGDGPHTYRFTLHALDADLDVDPGAERGALEDAMEGSVMGEMTLTGTYER